MGWLGYWDAHSKLSCPPVLGACFPVNEFVDGIDHSSKKKEVQRTFRYPVRGSKDLCEIQIERALLLSFSAAYPCGSETSVAVLNWNCRDIELHKLGKNGEYPLHDVAYQRTPLCSVPLHTAEATSCSLPFDEGADALLDGIQ